MAIKLYAAKAEAERTFPAPIAVAKVTPTEVVLVVSEMLRAVNISPRGAIVIGLGGRRMKDVVIRWPGRPYQTHPVFSNRCGSSIFALLALVR